MVNLPFITSDWKRELPREPQLPLLNRFYEQDPVSNDGEAALISRPGLCRWLEVGSGPIRGLFSQAGVFDDALFVVSGSGLYRIDQDETITTIASSVAGDPYNYVSMVATDTHLFVADGVTLWAYTDDGYATGTLTATGAIIATETVRIGDMHYAWTAGSVDTGAPAGTLALPWLVKLGGSTAASLENLAAAVEGSGTPGTTYSAVLEVNPGVAVNNVTATVLYIRAMMNGVGGNSITTTETGANLSWGAGTLEDGGDTSYVQVDMPDGVGAIWVDVLASYVIVVVAEGFGMNGRIYWVEPGEIEIDPLNFATAERAPDPLYHAVTFGDNVWLFGSGTAESWYPTGDGDAPFQRVQGRVFDHGVWEGTPVKYKQAMVVVDQDGVVWDITGEPNRISNYGIEQRIREAMSEQIKWS